MSQENVEVVRRLYELWNRGDFDAVVGMLDQHFVWIATSRCRIQELVTGR